MTKTKRARVQPPVEAEIPQLEEDAGDLDLGLDDEILGEMRMKVKLGTRKNQMMGFMTTN